VGETRVDLLHLLEDLRDAYPGALEETILTEIVANALDSGGARIRLHTGTAQATLTVVDDGCGMRRRELARYHDVAASTKSRGEGIGFAGVGIKLALLVCEEVLTETRRGKTHVATRWHLASRHRAPWKWVPPPGLVAERGTAACLKVQNALSPLLDAGFVEATLRRHYQPLFDPTFDQVLTPHYPHGVAFEVNGRQLERHRWEDTDAAPLAIRLARRRKPSAVGTLVRAPLPLPEHQRGLGVSTLGKVIKQGWDWLGVTPAAPDRVGGLIEVPALAACLTLNKADFIRVGTRGATYLAYRKAIQEAVSRQLGLWGDARNRAEEAHRRAARPLERDLERVLMDLAGEFPLLATLVERRADGQRSLPIGRAARMADARALLAASVTLMSEATEGTDGAATPAAAAAVVAEVAAPAATGEAGEPPGAVATVEAPPSPPAAPPANSTMLPGERGARRPASLGLGIQFEDRPGDVEIGRLVESTVWVNEAHPAYRRAAASRSEGYHVALAVALALAPLAVEPEGEHGFVTAFLACWGEAFGRTAGRKRRTQ
jgi:hypothetical protein